MLIVSGGYWLLWHRFGSGGLGATLVLLLSVFQWELIVICLSWFVTRGWGIRPYRMKKSSDGGRTFFRLVYPLSALDISLAIACSLLVFFFQVLAVFLYEEFVLLVALAYVVMALLFFLFAGVTLYRLADLGVPGKTGRPRMLFGIPIPCVGRGSFEELNAETGKDGVPKQEVEVDHTSGENELKYSMENVRSKMRAVTAFRWVALIVFALIGITVALELAIGHRQWVSVLWFESVDFFFGFILALIFRRKAKTHRSAVEDVFFITEDERKAEKEKDDGLMDMDEFDSMGFYY